ncbi:MAG: hypothetical protein PF517_00355 [Salinivirgaceae bacterium]|jgi:hypothetical protein|nr:hypothetical protein [Salinivirgaceae bacterium]
MNKLILTVLFFTIGVLAYSQTKIDSITHSILGNPVSIYEFGAPLTSCETNFENLFKNWNPSNVTNAREYELLDFKFVETIADTVRYSFYRNYFSGGEPLCCSIASFSSKTSKLKNLNGKPYHEETENSERFVRATYIHSELFDQRGLPYKAKKILSEEFKRQAQELLTCEINIDTMELKYISGDIIRIDTLRSGSDPFGKSVEYIHQSYKLASTDSISKDYIDISLKNLKGNSSPNEDSFDDLNMQRKRALILEELLIERITQQVLFNKLVHFGDKVYVVMFMYNGAMYSVYVICNPDTKKVVVDHFFNGVTIRTRK